MPATTRSRTSHATPPNPPPLLLTLPPELRLQIYTHLIPAGSTVFLPRYIPAPSTNNTGHTQVFCHCPRPYESFHKIDSSANQPACHRARMLTAEGIRPEAWKHIVECAYCIRKCPWWACVDGERVNREVEALRVVLALLGTCRVVYGEVARVFYDRVVFRVLAGDPETNRDPRVVRLLGRVGRVRVVCDEIVWGKAEPRARCVEGVKFSRAWELALELPEDVDWGQRRYKFLCDCLLGRQLPELSAVRLVAAWAAETGPRNGDSKVYELKHLMEGMLVQFARPDVTVDVVEPRLDSGLVSPFCVSLAVQAGEQRNWKKQRSDRWSWVS